MSAPSAADAITGLVLAGGAGRRMGGRDKGLIELAGRPLTAWALDGLRLQVGALLISANRELDAYRAWGVPVVTDAEPDFPGPLAGVLAGLRAADTGWLLSLPCDAPAVPPDLARRLHAAVIADDAELAVARSAGRLHPLHALWSTALAGDLAAGLAAGQRKVTDWQNTRRRVIVDFDQQPEAFENVNTPEQLAAYAARRDAAHGS